MPNKRTTDFYRKKVHQLAKELEETRRGAEQMQYAVDGILTQILLRYGEKVYDDKDLKKNGKPKLNASPAGYRITIASPEILAGWTLKTDKNKEGEYIIGLIAPMEEEAKS